MSVDDVRRGARRPAGTAPTTIDDEPARRRARRARRTGSPSPRARRSGSGSPTIATRLPAATMPPIDSSTLRDAHLAERRRSRRASRRPRRARTGNDSPISTPAPIAKTSGDEQRRPHARHEARRRSGPPRTGSRSSRRPTAPSRLDERACARAKPAARHEREEDPGRRGPSRRRRRTSARAGGGAAGARPARRRPRPGSGGSGRP